MALGMSNNYTTKIKGLFYYGRSVDFSVWCAPVFAAASVCILKRTTFPWVCTFRPSPQMLRWCGWGAKWENP